MALRVFRPHDLRGTRPRAAVSIAIAAAAALALCVGITALMGCGAKESAEDADRDTSEASGDGWYPPYEGSVLSDVQEAGRRAKCRNQLHQIGTAMHAYDAVFGYFPPPYTVDKAGRPLHSWRVLLLPYFDEMQLYNQIKLNEPWNSPHNRALADRMPSVYRCPSHAGSNQSETDYVVVVGPHTAFPGASRGGRAEGIRDVQVRDGMALTVFVVERVQSGINWMEPRDLDIKDIGSTINARSGKGIRSNHPGGAHVLCGDGSTHFLRPSLRAQTLRALLTRDDGEAIDMSEVEDSR
jgi:hypothetical protein